MAFKKNKDGQTTGSFEAMSQEAVIQKSHKTKRNRRIAIIVGCIVAVFLCAGVACAAYVSYLGDMLNKGDKTDDELAAIDDALTTTYETSLDKPFYMMLIGSDKREGNESMGARSDVNILVRVDPETHTVNLVSIPRDTKIEIDGYGTQKFNAAYAFDGAAGAIKAAENLLGIEISHYAEVNFGELANMIDAIGGVTVTVEEGEGVDDEKCDDYDGKHYVIEEGTQTLSGAEALTFSRSRAYPTGDFIRQKHQRQVIQAVIDKVMNLSIDKIPAVITAACNCVTTDLSVTDIIGLAQIFANADDLKVYSAMLPSYTQNINGISFVINDEELTKEMMKLVAAGEDPSGIVSTTTAADVYDSYIDTSQTVLFSDDSYYDTQTDTSTTQSSSATSSSASTSSSAPTSSSASAEVSTDSSASNSGTSSSGTTSGDSADSTSTSGTDSASTSAGAVSQESDTSGVAVQSATVEE
jgi:LCP family protein required for cell wall assembly